MCHPNLIYKRQKRRKETREERVGDESEFEIFVFCFAR